MPHSTTARRTIAVFAHNEARNIISCLASVRRAMRDGDEVHVLENGSSDKTGTLVQRFAEANGSCRLVSIAPGDKSNAWNVFCHDVRASAGLFIFMDGDCTVSPDSFDELESCLEANQHANAASGTPDARVSSRYRAAVIEEGGLVGNLYALRAGFVERVRAEHVRLPIGFIGDDSLVGALVRWDLDPRGVWDAGRTVVCKDAVFSYPRLSPMSARDWRLYWRRKIRYSLRHLQLELIRPRLKADGLAGMPTDVRDMYVGALAELRLRWRGLDTCFDYLALRDAKKQLEARGH